MTDLVLFGFSPFRILKVFKAPFYSSSFTVLEEHVLLDTQWYSVKGTLRQGMF